MHVIVGAGAVGTATATLLAEQGEQVRIVTRSGGGPVHPAIERIAADAANAEQLTNLTEGATALYNIANPAYHRWLTDWPPLISSFMTTAERTGAVLVTTGNLYYYGEVSGPMTEQNPLAATHPKLRLRGQFWLDALAAHEAGRIRTTEVRGSDYLEAQSIFTFAMGAPLLAGKRAQVPVPLDVPHTWTSVKDMAKMLVIAARDERAWGRAWHAPSNPAMTVQELAAAFTKANDLPEPKLSELPYPLLWTVGLFDKMVKELRTTRYQFTRPFVMDSSLAEDTFGIRPEPLDDVLRDVAARLHAANA